jgi:hypothetical protein
MIVPERREGGAGERGRRDCGKRGFEKERSPWGFEGLRKKGFEKERSPKP